MQDFAESEDDREELRSRLADMSEENEKMKTSMNFLEEQKRRLQEKVEKMTDAGVNSSFSAVPHGFMLCHIEKVMVLLDLVCLTQRRSWFWSWNKCGFSMAFAEKSALRRVSMLLSAVWRRTETFINKRLSVTSGLGSEVWL